MKKISENIWEFNPQVYPQLLWVAECCEKVKNEGNYISFYTLYSFTNIFKKYYLFKIYDTL